MTYPAKKTGFVIREKYFSTVEYEYRGSKYEVTYANGWTVCVTPAWVQHKEAQERIDQIIDGKEEEKHCTENAQVGFDKLWDYIQTGIWEE